MGLGFRGLGFRGLDNNIEKQMGTEFVACGINLQMFHWWSEDIRIENMAQIVDTKAMPKP